LDHQKDEPSIFGETQMKYVADFFALVGLVATVIAVGFYIGYVTLTPKCHTVGALFTKECK
jgi:hypothetical protein